MTIRDAEYEHTRHVVGTRHVSSAGTGHRDTLNDPDKERAIIARRLNDALKAQGLPAWYTPDDIDPVTFCVKEGR